MNRSILPSKSLHVIAALGMVAALAGLLTFRLMAVRLEPPASATFHGVPAGNVPAPKPVDLKSLEVPCWSCRDALTWPLTFRTDLDLLAPLGTGTENAAVWFKDFAKEVGSRAAEAEAAMERRRDAPGGLDKVLPPDDPLLREAEPWCDQVEMRFFPDCFELAGYDTRIPNLLFMLTLAKSWVARGNEAADPAVAMEDNRRAIRLGRLLRAEDVLLINDLVGLACIRFGAEGIYKRAIEQGDIDLAMVASVVLGEAAPQKLMTSQRVTSVDIDRHIGKDAAGRLAITLPRAKLAEIIDLAGKSPDRRFRNEVLMSLHFVSGYGAGESREMAGRVIDDLARDPDPVVSATAKWCLDHEPDPKYLEEALQKSQGAGPR